MCPNHVPGRLLPTARLAAALPDDATDGAVARKSPPLPPELSLRAVGEGGWQPSRDDCASRSYDARLVGRVPRPLPSDGKKRRRAAAFGTHGAKGRHLDKERRRRA